MPCSRGDTYLLLSKMAGFLAFASDIRAFPDFIVQWFLSECVKKAITVAGTAPVLHRIPSLPHRGRMGHHQIAGAKV